jgi:hypothetical protein
MLLIWSVVGLLPLLEPMVAAATLRVLAAGGALRLYRLVAFMVDELRWSKKLVAVSSFMSSCVVCW